MAVSAEWLQFSGFMDDEVGKLAHLTPQMYARLIAAKDPYEEMQNVFNPTSIDDLNTHLLNAAFFLEPQLVVDGWFIQTPGWWSSFFEPSVNLLPHMLASGLCVSFTRGGPLSD